MKKKYTKKQITEAIAYWEKQLKLMNESISYEDELGFHTYEQILDDKIIDNFQKRMTKALMTKNYDEYKKLHDEFKEYLKDKLSNEANKINMKKTINDLQNGLANLRTFINLAMTARKHDLDIDFTQLLMDLVNKILRSIGEEAVYPFDDFLRKNESTLKHPDASLKLPIFVNVPSKNELI